MSDGDTVLVDTRAGVGRITLNAPDRLNAVDPQMLADLADAIHRLDINPQVRVIVVAGAGRGFCSGAALGNGATPSVALVHGVAAGAGVSIALACDYVLASEAASFVLAFARIALMPDGGATALVAANIGRARAMRLALTGEKLDGPTAEEWGLVSELVPAGDFDRRAEDVVAALASRGPLASTATKRSINAATLSLDDTLAREERGQSTLLRTDDFVEGVMAFREKREARFTGR